MNLILLKVKNVGIPGGPVVRTQHFHCRGLRVIPGKGTKITQALQHGRKKKKKKKERKNIGIQLACIRIVLTANGKNLIPKGLSKMGMH